MRDSREIKELSRGRFLMEEVKWLQEAVWMRQIATWVSQHPGDSRVEAWIEGRAAEMDPLEAEHLALATRLFDWTIRNLQLDELLPYPADVAAQAGPAAGWSGNATDSTSAAWHSWTGIPALSLADLDLWPR